MAYNSMNALQNSFVGFIQDSVPISHKPDTIIPKPAAVSPKGSNSSAKSLGFPFSKLRLEKYIFTDILMFLDNFQALNFLFDLNDETR